MRLPADSPPNSVIVSPPDTGIESSLDPNSLRSPIVNINLSSPLPKGDFSALICLTLNERDDNIDDLCLGYYDEDQDEWICEDSCLQETSNQGRIEACGETDHFTNFAILLVGGGGVNGDPCASSGDFYFTGDWRGDAAVAGGVALIILFLCVSIVLVATIKKEIEKRRLKDELNTAGYPLDSFSSSSRSA